MRRLLAFAFVAVLCAGCTTTYRITLMGGEFIDSKGKPSLDAREGRYYFIDMHGHTNSISTSRVREIEPASRAEKEKS